MKLLILLSTLLIVMGCAYDKKVYLCGDHVCSSNEEKEEFFKKTMIVEIKEMKEKNNINESGIERILKQNDFNKKENSIEEKKITKQIRTEEKKRAKVEKKLAKQLLLEEKKRAREEKKIAKQLRLEEKKREKKNKDISFEQKQDSIDKIETNISIAKIKISLDDFDKLTDKIMQKNKSKPYPNINNIPN